MRSASATGDRLGRVETHGVDAVGDAERHGRPRSLFAVWAASNITYLYIVLGGTLVLLGLDVWQSLGVIVAGNLLWLLVGWLSVSGPASGSPSEVVTRAVFGVRGNRVVDLVLGWGVGAVRRPRGAVGSQGEIIDIDTLTPLQEAPVG